MKYKDLYKRLREVGCFISRHGSRHDIWYSPITGNKRPVPRHGSKEVSTGTLKAIEEELLGL
ncbi:MAG: type II toxin-antitoxin system HicA family toxin [Prevotellaceae bacterium]|nr:type II toxin-antitoxin system HicA family toxin [Prevotellaceae bacterium]